VRGETLTSQVRHDAGFVVTPKRKCPAEPGRGVRDVSLSERSEPADAAVSIEALCRFPGGIEPFTGGRQLVERAGYHNLHAVALLAIQMMRCHPGGVQLTSDPSSTTSRSSLESGGPVDDEADSARQAIGSAALRSSRVAAQWRASNQSSAFSNLCSAAQIAAFNA
jgi:hypothetical protein